MVVVFHTKTLKHRGVRRWKRREGGREGRRIRSLVLRTTLSETKRDRGTKERKKSECLMLDSERPQYIHTTTTEEDGERGEMTGEQEGAREVREEGHVGGGG